MRKAFLIALVVLVIVGVFYVTSENKIAKLIVDDARPSLLFLKNCRYDAFYIESESGEVLASLMYSEAPGHGPIFKQNTFIALDALLNIKIKKNIIYNLSGNTECLSSRQVPRKHFKFMIKDDGQIDTLEDD
ncbi:hypothetical protein ABGV49_11770 [Chromobacterium vaccinii]|uniref:Lysozyme inhibitor n=1 Tax=Chromobacterium vaccinii TaxID=1108595 RepID=A0ABV0FFP6_9NEIS